MTAPKKKAADEGKEPEFAEEMPLDELESNEVTAQMMREAIEESHDYADDEEDEEVEDEEAEDE